MGIAAGAACSGLTLPTKATGISGQPIQRSPLQTRTRTPRGTRTARAGVTTRAIPFKFAWPATTALTTVAWPPPRPPALRKVPRAAVFYMPSQAPGRSGQRLRRISWPMAPSTRTPRTRTGTTRVRTAHDDPLADRGVHLGADQWG